MFEGKNAIVTGGTRGIGRAIVEGLIEKKCNVALIYCGSIDKAAEVEAYGAQKGVVCKAYQCNVADFDAVKSTVECIYSDFKSIQYLVNNAGMTRDRLLLRMTEEDFDVVCDTNLKGAFNMLKHVTAKMIKERFGRIVNVSSVVGMMGNAGQINYSASKAGIIGLTKSAAKELSSRNITVNAVAPGFIDTDMTDKLTDEMKAKVIEMVPLKRTGKPQDVARVVEALLTFDYVTGEVVKIDGGLYI